MDTYPLLIITENKGHGHACWNAIWDQIQRNCCHMPLAACRVLSWSVLMLNDVCYLWIHLMRFPPAWTYLTHSPILKTTKCIFDSYNIQRIYIVPFCSLLAVASSNSLKKSRHSHDNKYTTLTWPCARSLRPLPTTRRKWPCRFSMAVENPQLKWGRS